MFETELAAGDDFTNPLSSSEDSLQHTAKKSRPGVLPEYDESDGNLAQPVASEDLFEVITESLQSGGEGNRKEQAEQQIHAMFKEIKDWDAPIQKKDLKRMLEVSLQTNVSNAVLADLFRQIDTDGDETVSAREFDAWFKKQSRLVDASDDSIDPRQAQLQRMQSQSFILDPNSEFRGNWDMVQAVLLSEPRVHSLALFSAAPSSRLPCSWLMELGELHFQMVRTVRPALIPPAGFARSVHRCHRTVPHRLRRQRRAVELLLLLGPDHRHLLCR